MQVSELADELARVARETHGEEGDQRGDARCDGIVAGALTELDDAALARWGIRSDNA